MVKIRIFLSDQREKGFERQKLLPLVQYLSSTTHQEAQRKPIIPPPPPHPTPTSKSNNNKNIKIQPPEKDHHWGVCHTTMGGTSLHLDSERWEFTLKMHFKAIFIAFWKDIWILKSSCSLLSPIHTHAKLCSGIPPSRPPTSTPFPTSHTGRKRSNTHFLQKISSGPMDTVNKIGSRLMVVTSQDSETEVSDAWTPCLNQLSLVLMTAVTLLKIPPFCKQLKTNKKRGGSQDGLLVRAMDLWLKGCEFESQQELWENFFSRVNFVCWLLFSVCSTPVLPQWHIKEPSHSAKSAGGRLHLNMHKTLTQWSWHGLTMPLSRRSVGTYQKTHTQIIREHLVTAISARWATVDWSWPREWN